MPAITRRRGWMIVLLTGGVVALAATALASRAHKRPLLAPEPDWATHSSYAEQSAVAYFD